MADHSLRFYIDLIEAAQEPWLVAKDKLFAQSFQDMKAKVPDLPQRLDRFLEIKLPNPISIRVGKNDRAFKDYMPGYLHVHLAPDAILIYRLANRTLQLAMICQHADLEGNRLKQTARKLVSA